MRMINRSFFWVFPLSIVVTFLVIRVSVKRFKTENAKQETLQQRPRDSSPVLEYRAADTSLLREYPNNPERFKGKVLFRKAKYIEVVVDLNDYLGFVDPGTDWNYTELDDYTDSVLRANNIRQTKGYWVRKIKK